MIEEYVFVCPLEDAVNDKVIPFYISKEYNVGPFDEPRMPGRFIFRNLAQRVNIPYYMVLAEEPAIAYTEPGFSIESYYLQMRKYIQPGTGS